MGRNEVLTGASYDSGEQKTYTKFIYSGFIYSECGALNISPFLGGGGGEVTKHN